MKQAAPGKVLVVFLPLAKYRLGVPGGELRPPWACEVSAVPRPRDFVAYFDASVPRHPERRAWKRTDRDKEGHEAVTWGAGSERELYRVTGGSLYVPDLDVFMVPVEIYDKRDLAPRLEDRLQDLARALDIDEPQKNFETVVLRNEQQTKEKAS